jgi:AAA domain
MTMSTLKADNNLDKLHPCSWAELLRRKHREMLIDDLLFTTGVTTLVAPSGEGKTTFAMSIALAVDLGMWGDKLIQRRPVVWIAGEGQDDLKPMYQAIMQQTHNRSNPEGFYLEEPVNLSSWNETNKLINLLNGMPPTLIIADALADMLGDLNEDTAKDINQVYRNIWRIVRANKACFLIPHHSGWDDRRERGSTAIRAKSDIVAQIIAFNPETGVAELRHNKRRGGAKLKQFFFGIDLVPVAGYTEPIPIVSGPKIIIQQQPINPVEVNARNIVEMMVQHFPDGAPFSRLLKQSGLAKNAFCDGLNYAKYNSWIIGGGERGKPYNLNPNGSWKNSVQSSVGSVASVGLVGGLNRPPKPINRSDQGLQNMAVIARADAG